VPLRKTPKDVKRLRLSEWRMAGDIADVFSGHFGHTVRGTNYGRAGDEWRGTKLICKVRPGEGEL
jgi:hypothetical protein